MSELHEIWQIEGKQLSDLDLRKTQASPKFRQIPSLRLRK